MRESRRRPVNEGLNDLYEDSYHVRFMFGEDERRLLRRLFRCRPKMIKLVASSPPVPNKPSRGRRR
jgi:hypothetical protein